MPDMFDALSNVVPEYCTQIYTKCPTVFKHVLDIILHKPRASNFVHLLETHPNV